MEALDSYGSTLRYCTLTDAELARLDSQQSMTICRHLVPVHAAIRIFEAVKDPSTLLPPAIPKLAIHQLQSHLASTIGAFGSAASILTWSANKSISKSKISGCYSELVSP